MGIAVIMIREVTLWGHHHQEGLAGGALTG